MKPPPPISYDERDLIARGIGKWSDPDIPKTEWQNEYVFDLGKGNLRICEMCETVHIRFVHVMKHNIGLQLNCGCICAGHMSEDISAARKRDDDIQKAARRVERRFLALSKAKNTLRDLSRPQDNLVEIVDVLIPALERLKRVAKRRAQAASDDAQSYPNYLYVGKLHEAFLNDVDGVLDSTRANLGILLAKQKQAELKDDLSNPRWRRTARGYRFVTIHGDKAQIYGRDDGYGAMYELAGIKAVWSNLTYATATDAQKRVLLVMTKALQKRGRLADS